MTSDLDTELTKVLYRSPHLGARCAQLFGDALAADDDGSVLAQQADDAAEARVGRRAVAGVDADWGGGRDRKIMREGEQSWVGLIREQGSFDSGAPPLRMTPPKVWLVANCQALSAASYAGAMRMLRSTAFTECVRAPTEMKFTPVSA